VEEAPRVPRALKRWGVWGAISGPPTFIEGSDSMELRGKKVIALGERDGVPGPAVAECARRAGAEVVLTLTACFV
jgi:glycine/sarcosine/betaine reductase complex component A